MRKMDSAKREFSRRLSDELTSGRGGTNLQSRLAMVSEIAREYALGRADTGTLRAWVQRAWRKQQRVQKRLGLH